MEPLARPNRRTTRQTYRVWEQIYALTFFFSFEKQILGYFDPWRDTASDHGHEYDHTTRSSPHEMGITEFTKPEVWTSK